MKKAQTKTITSRLELMEAAHQRLLHTNEEFNRAYKILKKYDKTVSIFGSARTPVNHPNYQKARSLAYTLAKEGYVITSGGGGGIMQAANHGAHDAGAPSIGFNIKLPHEQVLNKYVTESASFHYFFARKVMLVFFSTAIIVFPGGFGTIDEMSETLTLIQTKKIPNVPVILVGKEYWSEFDRFIRKMMLPSALISPGDEKLYTITDDLDEVVRIVEESSEGGEIELPAMGLETTLL